MSCVILIYMSEDQQRRYEDHNPNPELSDAIAELLKKQADLQQQVDALREEKLAAQAEADQLRQERDQEQYNARHDALTGLLNRGGYDQLVNSYISVINQLESEGADMSEYNGVILQFDLTRFKKVNDTFGHDTGDLFLQKAAERLRSTFRTDPKVRGLKDILARIGGDEFRVIIPKLKVRGTESYSVEDLRQSIVQRLDSIEVEFEHHGEMRRETLSSSVGLIPFELQGLTREGLDRADKEADQLMYEHKAEQHAA